MELNNAVVEIKQQNRKNLKSATRCNIPHSSLIIKIKSKIKNGTSNNSYNCNKNTFYLNGKMQIKEKEFAIVKMSPLENTSINKILIVIPTHFMKIKRVLLCSTIY